MLLGRGWTAEQVAEALLLDANTVRNQVKRDRQDGVADLRTPAATGGRLVGRAGCVSANQVRCAGQGSGRLVKEKSDIAYTASGMTAKLHRVESVYTKAKLVPGKADPAAQEAYVVDHEDVTHTKGDSVAICLMDTVHPQHNALVACGWIKRGQGHEDPSNMGRRGVNIDGPISLEDLEPLVRFDYNPNAESTIAPFEQVEEDYAVATWIIVICDNARHCRTKAVQKYTLTLPTCTLLGDFGNSSGRRFCTTKL